MHIEHQFTNYGQVSEIIVIRLKVITKFFSVHRFRHATKIVTVNTSNMLPYVGTIQSLTFLHVMPVARVNSNTRMAHKFSVIVLVSLEEVAMRRVVHVISIVHRSL